MHTNHPLTQLWHSQAVREARHFASPRRWYRYLTADLRPLPSVVIAGAQKAGTTSLFGYLAGHPLCRRPLTKEVNFFDQNFRRGERWYRMHFPYGPTSQRGQQSPAAGAFCIEASPHYMFDPQVAARVHALLPHMKSIFLLRNPVSRAYSHYQHQVRRGREMRPFEECIEAEVQLEESRLRPTAGATNRQGPPREQPTYLARGVYVNQLRNWREHFPAKQMLVIEAERMFKQPREVLQEVLAFLELEAWQPRAFGNLNPGRYSTPMSAAARDHAGKYFAPHNEDLFQFLGQRYDWR